MSHPPCNVENSCDTMVEEIKHGCESLARSAPSNVPSFCGARQPVVANAPTGQGLAHYECPASLAGQPVFNWFLAEGASSPQNSVRQGLAPDGAVTWTFTPRQSAQGTVHIVCGYDGPRTVNVPIAAGIRHCRNPEMTHEYMCDSR